MKTQPLHSLLLFALFLSVLSVTTEGTHQDAPQETRGYWQGIGEKMHDRLDQMRHAGLDDGLD